MLIDVHLKDAVTGECRLYADGYDWPITDEPDFDGRTGREALDALISFMYGDGNYACDCNRSILFAEANNEDRDADVCCNGDRYIVEKIVERGTDRVIYAD